MTKILCYQLSVIIALFSSVCFAQPPDMISLNQAKELGFEVKFEKEQNSKCIDYYMLSPLRDPVNPKYDDIKVSLRMFKDKSLMTVFSLKNHVIISKDKIHYEHNACLPQGIFEEIFLTIVYEPKTDKKAELKCLKESSIEDEIKCTVPSVCHQNWQIDISEQINSLTIL